MDGLLLVVLFALLLLVLDAGHSTTQAPPVIVVSPSQGSGSASGIGCLLLGLVLLVVFGEFLIWLQSAGH